MASSESPVTWHVLFWLLTSLAINSMAQPHTKLYGSSRRYRLYLSSSPIICAADAVSFIVCIASTMLYLRTSPKKASQLVNLLKSDGLSTEKPAEDPQNHTWPRWLFFIMGTLPAAIKLGSFTGVPWTQAFGMMFVASFTTIELFTLLSRSAGDTASVPAILGFSAFEWEEAHHENLRLKTSLLTRRMAAFNAMLFVFALIGHIILIVWTIQTLWLTGLQPIYISSPASYMVDWIQLCIYGLISLLTAILLVLRCSGHDYNIIIHRILKNSLLWMLKFVLFFCLVPKWGKGPPPSRFNSWADVISIWSYMGVFLYVYFRGMSSVCRRWPDVGEALLITREPRIGEELEQPAQSGSEAAHSSVEETLIEEDAWISFCFFLINLVVCLLWYAFMYDSTGTVNPSWTDVFG